MIEDLQECSAVWSKGDSSMTTVLPVGMLQYIVDNYTNNKI